ncbi:transporter substrate-binding domain-containing protein [Thioclava sp. GXIMD4216]|uniref:Transporter substrate-binding domain-containing protein n=1 Tax=Thioclava litoralis TaxID=3076557 RepID=A0ABZ1E6P1_9RHOB|nr:transporter substrate-binding domain-containing protein [Thioclava sp. FTW29]
MTHRPDGLPVGLLFSPHSLTAEVEKTQIRATCLAIEEVNAQGGVNGRPLVPHLPDIGAGAADYRRAAERLCAEADVQVFFGTHMSNSRKATLPVVEGRGALLFYPTLYEGFEFSRNCLYTGAAPNQNSVQLAAHILTRYGKRVFFVGNNYVFAHESNRIMRDLFEQAQGTVCAEIYLPFEVSAEALQQVMAQAEALAPDVIYSTLVGRDTVKLHEAFARSPLRGRGVPIASVATNEADLAQMGAELAEGCLAAAPYFSSLRSDASLRFVAAYRARFGAQAPITAGAEAAYSQVWMFALAAAQAGFAGRAGQAGLSPLLEALGTVRFDAPQGPVKLDMDTHHSYLWPRIAQASAQGVFEVIGEAARRVKPEPFMVQHHFGGAYPEHV